MNKRIYKVLVVDDSAFMRKVIGDIISSSPNLLLAGTARDGEDALKKVDSCNPDVITLDVEMPKKDGLAVLRELMAKRPIPVVMVSSRTFEGADTTLRALNMGAVDFVLKPSGPISLNMDAVQEELVSKVSAAAEIDMSHLARKQVPRRGDKVSEKTVAPSGKAAFLEEMPQPGKKIEVVAIASSTGGPRALQALLPLLPGNFPVPVVVVQHMPQGFTTSLARRMDDLSAISVEEAKEGTLLKKGTAIIAPGGLHLLLKEKNGLVECTLSKEPPVNSVRPAADLLFESVARIYGPAAVGVILTGMGKDGTQGAKLLRERGAVVLGESPETCVIYGMPKMAWEAGYVQRQIPLDGMADALEKLVRNR